MRRPANLTRAEERRCDRLDDLAISIANVRRALERGPRHGVETFVDCFARRLNCADIDIDDADELKALAGFLAGRVRSGLHDRLRTFLLPVVAALESMLELASEEQ